MDDIELRFPHLKDLPAMLDDSIHSTPDRIPNSIRRTATIDMVWPGGVGTPLHLIGRARDLLTTTTGEPKVLEQARMRAEIDATRTINRIEADPERAGIEQLVGARGGRELRAAIDRALPSEREAATPLHLLLDDIAGTSLIAGYAWSQTDFETDWGMANDQTETSAFSESDFGQRKGKVICSGLRPNGLADTLYRHDGHMDDALVPAGDIRTPGDPHGWHEFEPDPDVGMRRHRRIDLWHEDGVLAVESFFRDICWDPDGVQQALHEYSVRAEVDPTNHTLVSVKATPRVLPFPECQWAAAHAQQLVGMRASNFRTTVQETLVGLKACTHLNDMLRCLAEVPALAARL